MSSSLANTQSVSFFVYFFFFFKQKLPSYTKLEKVFWEESIEKLMEWRIMLFLRREATEKNRAVKRIISKKYCFLEIHFHFHTQAASSAKVCPTCLKYSGRSF